MTDVPSRPLHIGILGAANIARLFVDAARPSRKVEIRAVASRDAERGRKFAGDLGIATVHATYEALLADPGIDAIYNPLPNNLHAEWSIRAADAGKHVLCEKPLATSAAEARAMFDAARRNGVHVVEGYPYRAQPQTRKLRELLAAGAIGRLQTIQAAFGFPLGGSCEHPHESGAGRRRADGCGQLSGEPRAHDRGRTAGTRAGGGALGGNRRRPHARGDARVPLRRAGADHVQLRDRAPSARLHRRRRGNRCSRPICNDTGPGMPPVLEITRGTGWDAKREIDRDERSRDFSPRRSVSPISSRTARDTGRAPRRRNRSTFC